MIEEMVVGLLRRLEWLESNVRELLTQEGVRSAVRAYRTTAWSHSSSGASLAVALDNESYDTEGMHDNVTNNSRLTAVVGGIYAILGGGEFAANATGVRQMAIRLNGTTTLYPVGKQNYPGSVVCWVHVSVQFKLAAGDYVELMAYQDSGGSLNVGSAVLGMVRI